MGLEHVIPTDLSFILLKTMPLGNPLYDYGKIIVQHEVLSKEGEREFNLHAKHPSVLETRNIHVSRCNAAFAYFRNRIVVCSRFLSPYNEVLTIDRMACNWHDWNAKPNITEDSYLKDPRCIDCPSAYLFGEDPRIIPFENHLIMIYNYFNVTEWKARRMILVKLLVDEKDNFYVDGNVNVVHFKNHENIDQKNWSPFIYRDSLYFVYSIFPHHVVHLFPLMPPPRSPPSSQQQQQNHGVNILEKSTFNHNDYHRHRHSHADLTAELVSASIISDFSWHYGKPRGSTPAVLLDDSLYLSFFHSRHKNLITGRETYFFGAYTFAKHPPFEILSFSPVPIVTKTFYQGKFKSWHFDYIVFPTSFSYDHQYIYLFVGKQDEETWMLKLDKVSLLASLRQVNSTVIGSSSWTASSAPNTNKYGNTNTTTDNSTSTLLVPLKVKRNSFQYV